MSGTTFEDQCRADRTLLGVVTREQQRLVQFVRERRFCTCPARHQSINTSNNGDQSDAANGAPNGVANGAPNGVANSVANGVAARRLDEEARRQGAREAERLAAERLAAERLAAEATREAERKRAAALADAARRMEGARRRAAEQLGLARCQTLGTELYWRAMFDMQRIVNVLGEAVDVRLPELARKTDPPPTADALWRELVHVRSDRQRSGLGVESALALWRRIRAFLGAQLGSSALEMIGPSPSLVRARRQADGCFANRRTIDPRRNAFNLVDLVSRAFLERFERLWDAVLALGVQHLQPADPPTANRAPDAASEFQTGLRALLDANDLRPNARSAQNILGKWNDTETLWPAPPPPR